MKILFSCKTSNSKHQMPLKLQIANFNDPNEVIILNFGHRDLLVICLLLFEI